MSRNFDAEYDDYKARQKAAMVDHKNGAGRSGRFKPMDEEKDEEKRKEEYGLPSNEYKMQGYTTQSSSISTDPVSAVRTVRNNLRVLSLTHRDKDEPVKAHLCQTACEELTKTEQQLVEMSRARSDAVFRGETQKSKDIAENMEKVKTDAIRNAYSDLMLDDKTMTAFGVKSKWTPDKNPMPADRYRAMTPIKGRRKEVLEEKNRKKEEEPKWMNNEKEELPVIKEQVVKPKGVRKNQRLNSRGPKAIPVSNPGQDESTVQDDPFKMPTYVGRCPHCESTENGLGRPGELQKHFSRSCKVMTCCKYCMKVTMVSQLTQHLIYRCEFLHNSMKECELCGLAVDRNDATSHPMCRGRKSPSGAQWCPLCTIAVEDNEEGWRNHLTRQCYNNPRNDGPERDPYDLKNEQDYRLAEAKRQEKQKEEQEQQAREEAQRKKVTTTSAVGFPGRVIDADKLVVALQEIQERKKAEKKKRLKEVEKND